MVEGRKSPAYRDAMTVENALVTGRVNNNVVRSSLVKYGTCIYSPWA